jgi:hypothetical protein
MHGLCIRAMMSVLVMISVHAEDAAGSTTTITPEALKAFIDAHTQAPGAPPPQNPLEHVSLPALPAQNPPGIDLPPPHPQHQDAQSGLHDFGGFDDVRLDGTLVASRYAIHAGGSGITASGHDDHAGRASAAWLGSPGLSDDGGFLLGLSCADQWLQTGDATSSLALRQYAVDVHAGYGLPWGRNLELEMVPYLGVLVAHGSIDRMTTVRGFGVDWGLRASAVYTWDAGVQCGVTVGYIGYESSVRASDGTRFGIRASGPCAGGTVGLRY